MKMVIVSAVGFLVSERNFFIMSELTIPTAIPIVSDHKPNLTNSYEMMNGVVQVMWEVLEV